MDTALPCCTDCVCSFNNKFLFLLHTLIALILAVASCSILSVCKIRWCAFFSRLISSHLSPRLLPSVSVCAIMSMCEHV